MCVRRWRSKARLITGWASSTFNNGYVGIEKSTFNLITMGNLPSSALKAVDWSCLKAPSELLQVRVRFGIYADLLAVTTERRFA